MRNLSALALVIVLASVVVVAAPFVINSIRQSISPTSEFAECMRIFLLKEKSTDADLSTGLTAKVARVIESGANASQKEGLSEVYRDLSDDDAKTMLLAAMRRCRPDALGLATVNLRALNPNGQSLSHARFKLRTRKLCETGKSDTCEGIVREEECRAGCTLRAEHDNYGGGSDYVSSFNALQPEVDIHLSPSPARLIVEVVDEEGTPIEGAKVGIRSTDPPQELKNVRNVRCWRTRTWASKCQWVFTDGEGRATFVVPHAIDSTRLRALAYGELVDEFDGEPRSLITLRQRRPEAPGSKPAPTARLARQVSRLDAGHPEPSPESKRERELPDISLDIIALKRPTPTNLVPIEEHAFDRSAYDIIAHGAVRSVPQFKCGLAITTSQNGEHFVRPFGFLAADPELGYEKILQSEDFIPDTKLVYAFYDGPGVVTLSGKSWNNFAIEVYVDILQSGRPSRPELADIGGVRGYKISYPGGLENSCQSLVRSK